MDCLLVAKLQLDIIRIKNVSVCKNFIIYQLLNKISYYLIEQILNIYTIKITIKIDKSVVYLNG